VAGFITMLATGTRRQRIGDLAARTAVARAVPMRHRGLALVPLAGVLLAAAGLLVYRATSAGNTLTYRAHGISFDYPAGWQDETGAATGTSGAVPTLWTIVVGLGTPHDGIVVQAIRVSLAVTAQNIDATAHYLESHMQQAGLAVQDPPKKITMAGLPGLRFRVTETGSASTRVFAFNGTTEYVVDCQHTPGMAAQVGRACDQVVGSFQVSRAVIAQGSPQAPQGQPNATVRQQAQSDLAALQHDDNFASDLRTLSSDAHQVGPDLATTKSDTALGNGCYNVSTVKIDASNVGADATLVSLDLDTLMIDIGTATQDIASMKADLANLTAIGLPAPPGATAAIAAGPGHQQGDCKGQQRNRSGERGRDPGLLRGQWHGDRLMLPRWARPSARADPPHSQQVITSTLPPRTWCSAMMQPRLRGLVRFIAGIAGRRAFSLAFPVTESGEVGRGSQRQVRSRADLAQPGRSSGRFAARWPCSRPVDWPTSMRYPSGSRI